jgi:hypothetical protein|tara:strand:+ start:470 stop:727 length:258 start_codon:yes stop_codon:yes gene_type:complete
MKISKNELKEMIVQEINNYNEELSEADEVKLPAVVKRFAGKFTDAIKASGLNRKRQIAVLGLVVDALGVDKSELMRFVQKIKRGM